MCPKAILTPYTEDYLDNEDADAYSDTDSQSACPRRSSLRKPRLEGRIFTRSSTGL